jgi:hypothetical protein
MPFRKALSVLENRIKVPVTLPLDKLQSMTLKMRLSEIVRTPPRIA